MDDPDDFDDPEGLEANLDEYLSELDRQNVTWRGYRVEWIRNDPRVGALHMWQKHGVSEEEVEQVIFELPPCVEAKTCEENGRIAFWGATRDWRWLVVVCEEGRDAAGTFLRPLTAFAPDNGRAYWEAL